MPVSILFNFTVTLPRILKKVKKMDNSVTKKRAQSNGIDMLNGPLFKKILLFALPLAASSLLQELFNSVEGLWQPWEVMRRSSGY